MGDCEVCGSKPAAKVAIIEGVRLNVCYDCAKHGKVIEKPAVAMPKAKGPAHNMGTHAKGKAAALQSSREEIMDDYAEILHKQISKIGLSYNQLAMSIDENESYLKRVVHGDTLPTLKLAKKLERALNIKITELPE